MTENYISIGKIISTHGLKGEVKVAHSGGLLSYVNVSSVVYEDSHGFIKKLKIHKNKNQGSFSIVSFVGFTRLEDVENLVGKNLYLHKSKFPKKEIGEYYVYELIGLHPRFNSQILSEYKVQKVMENPAHPILIFQGNGKEILVPFVSRFVGEVNLEKQYIEMIDWEDWFLDEI